MVFALLVLSAFFLLLAALYRFDNKYTAGPPYGEAGVFSFEQGDLDGPLFLIDGWLLDGREVFAGQYSNFSYLPGGASPFGVGTYRLTLRYAGPPTVLTLELPEIFSDYTLYVNGEIAAQRGSGTAVPVPVGGDTALVLETENHTHYYSGLAYPPTLGTAGVMRRLFFLRTLFYAVLCAASLTLAAFSLALWFSRTRDPLFRHFGLLCLAFVVSCAHPFVWQLGLSGPLWYALEDAARLLVQAQAAALATLAAGLEGRAWYRRLVRPALLGACVLCFATVAFIIPNAAGFVNFYGGLVDAWRLLVWAYLALCAGVGLARGGGWTSFFVLSACGLLGVSLLAGVGDAYQFDPIYTGWQGEWAGFLLVLLFGGLMARRNAELLRQSAQLQSIRLQNRFAEESAVQLRASMAQVRGLKHELRHHVESLEALYAAGDYPRLGAYLEALGGEKDALPQLYYAENFLVNAILAGRLGPARERGVRVACSASVPERLPMADGDLCTLLANLADNAVEACGRLPEGAERFIELSLEVRGDLFLISCANSAPPRTEEGGAFATAKPDRAAHGLGLPAMERVAEKYDGVLEAQQTGGVFTLRAALHLPRRDGGAGPGP